MGDDGDVDAEIAFHIDSATAENLARGMPPAEARAEAIRRFGNPERFRRECMEVRGGHPLPRAVAWVAVASLAATAFLAGYTLRGRGVGEAVVVRDDRVRVEIGTPRRAFPIGKIVEFRVLPSGTRGVLVPLPDSPSPPSPPPPK